MLRKRERPQDDPLRAAEGILVALAIVAVGWAVFVAVYWSVAP